VPSASDYLRSAVLEKWPEDTFIFLGWFCFSKSVIDNPEAHYRVAISLVWYSMCLGGTV